MLFSNKLISLKNGECCILRSPVENDAERLLQCLNIFSSETNFVLRYPEECTGTIEQEAAFLNNVNGSPYCVMIVAEINGELAGNCQINFNRRMKIMHRASIAIGIISKYWNIGLGSAMLGELIEVARAKGLRQLELEFIEGNSRARALYEKMGFSIVSCNPDAIILKDGTLLKEYTMILYL